MINPALCVDVSFIRITRGWRRNVPQESIEARKGSLSCFVVRDRRLKDQYGFIGSVCTSRTHAHTLRCRQTKRKAPATCCPFLWLTSVLHMRDSRETQDDTRTEGASGGGNQGSVRQGGVGVKRKCGGNIAVATMRTAVTLRRCTCCMNTLSAV